MSKPSKNTEQQNELLFDLKTLLIEGAVATQDDLCLALEKKGHQVNQSKISRLIRKINAIKSKNELGEIVYRLSHEPAPLTTENQLTTLVISIVANENMIVVNTSPGSSQLIARILDYHKERINIMGTIAGDDTIFVAPTSIHLINQIVHDLKSLLFIS